MREKILWHEFYEIRDSNNIVADTEKGFAPHFAAGAAGRKRAREMKASGWFGGGGVGTVKLRNADSVNRVFVPLKDKCGQPPQGDRIHLCATG